jgi:hypothetical protein
MPKKAQRTGRDITSAHSETGGRRRLVVSITLQTLYPARDPVPIIQKAGWASAPVSTARKNLPSSGFDPRTLQPVTSHYTDWAILAAVACQYPQSVCVPQCTRSSFTPAQNKKKNYNVKHGDSNCKGSRGQRQTLHSAEVTRRSWFMCDI